MSNKIHQRVGRVLIYICLGFLLPALISRADIAPATKPAIPSLAARQDAIHTANEIYAADLAAAKTPDNRTAIARKILQSALDEKTDLAARYTLLALARDTAATAGDLPLACHAIDATADSFQIDVPAAKADAAQAASRSLKTDQGRQQFVIQANDLVSELIRAERFDLAEQIAGLELTIAHVAGDPQIIRLAASRTQQTADLRAADIDVRQALKTLQSAPQDPDANLKVGRFRSLMLGDWMRGLPMLAQGADANLKSLASAELDQPSDSSAQLKVADGWWTTADAQTAWCKRIVQAHACDWYQKTLSTSSGLEKLKAQKRIEEFAQQNAAVTIAPATRLSNIPDAVYWTQLTSDMDTFRGCWKAEAGRVSVSFDPASHTVDIDGLRALGGFQIPRPWQQIAFDMALRQGDLENMTAGGVVLKSTAPLRINTALHVYIVYDRSAGEVDEFIDGQKVASGVVLDTRYPTNPFFHFFARGDTKLSIHNFYYLPAAGSPIQVAASNTNPPPSPPPANIPPPTPTLPSLLQQVVLSIDASGKIVVTLDSRDQPPSLPPRASGKTASLLYLKSADVTQLDNGPYELAYFFDNPIRLREYKAAIIDNPTLTIVDGNLIIHPVQQTNPDHLLGWQSTRTFGFPFRSAIDIRQFDSGTLTLWLRPQSDVEQFHHLAINISATPGSHDLQLALTTRDVRGPWAEQQILQATHPAGKLAEYDAQLPFACDIASASFGIATADGNVAIHSISITSSIRARLPIGFTIRAGRLTIAQIIFPSLAGDVRVGDQILAVDNAPVATEPDAAWAIQKRLPGEDIQLQIQRGADKKIVHVIGD